MQESKAYPDCNRGYWPLTNAQWLTRPTPLRIHTRGKSPYRYCGTPWRIEDRSTGQCDGPDSTLFSNWRVYSMNAYIDGGVAAARRGGRGRQVRVDRLAPYSSPTLSLRRWRVISAPKLTPPPFPFPPVTWRLEVIIMWTKVVALFSKRCYIITNSVLFYW